MVAEVGTATPLVVIVNEAAVCPAGTVMLVGTIAAVLLLDKATTAPPAGAGMASVTVPVVGQPPSTLDGLIDRPESAGSMERVLAWVPE